MNNVDKLPAEPLAYQPIRSTDLELNTYLPSLYLKKCRKVESLDRIRSQFPSVENVQTNANRLQIRPPTPWDNVLAQVQQEVYVRRELKKHEIALKSFLAKKCQLKFKTRQLKREEVYCFHRVLCSHLAERVVNKFAQVRTRDAERPAEPAQMPIERVPSVPQDLNDVFIDGEDERNFNNGGNNMFDDILLQPTPTAHVEEPARAASSDNYIYRMVELSGLQETPIRVERKTLLRKIKENLKKRQKYKERVNPNAPKTGAAEIILANLISNEPEEQPSREPMMIARNVSTSSMTQDPQKKRRRKDDGFVLNWQEADFEDQPRAKRFIEGRNVKFDNVNELLSLFVLKDPKNEYFTKSFEKTVKVWLIQIENDKEFPKRFQAVQSEHPEPNGQGSDGDYESFVERNGCNMESLIKHFTEVSEFLFPEQIDLSSRNHKLALDIKQLFAVGGINPEGKVLRYDKGMVHIMDEEYFKNNAVLKSLVDLRELYFLIEYYLAEFGNNWTLVTECLRLNPLARSMMLSRQQVENLHAYFNMKRGKNITCKDRLLLPFSNEFQDSKVAVEPPSQQPEFDLDNYEELIRRECSNRSSGDPRSSDIGRQFKRFEEYCESIGVECNHRTVIDSLLTDHRDVLESTLSEWRIVEEEKPYIVDKRVEKTEFAYQTKLTLPKNCKIASMKKRKLVSDRTSPLVQTLAKIKNRQQPPAPAGMMYKSGIKGDPTTTVASPAVAPPPAPLVKTQSIKTSQIKAEKQKEASELSKIHDSKKSEPTATPTKKPGEKAVDKKSGQKGGKKKDDKK